MITWYCDHWRICCINNCWCELHYCKGRVWRLLLLLLIKFKTPNRISVPLNVYLTDSGKVSVICSMLFRAAYTQKYCKLCHHIKSPLQSVFQTIWPQFGRRKRTMSVHSFKALQVVDQLCTAICVLYGI